MLQIYLIPLGAGKLSQWFHIASQHSQSYFINSSIQFLFFFFSQQHNVEAELQELFSHLNILAVTNSRSDTFPSSWFCWTSRDHSQDLTLLAHVGFPARVLREQHSLFSPQRNVYVPSYVTSVHSTGHIYPFSSHS